MLKNLRNKKIILGITGGIAAYKACELVRLLKKQSAEVKAIMTKSAMEFIQPLTLRALSGNKVYTQMFEQEIADEDIEHISLARWADYIIVAPATANCLAKILPTIY